MTVDIRILNRTAGGDGSPGGTGNQGNLALNFDPAAKTANGGLPKLFASDGTAWTLMNPPATAPTVGTATLLGGTAGSPTGIGAAWTALGTKPTDPIVIASYAGTAYVKTGAGGADTDWTSLGSAAQFASAAEILAGVVTNKAIAPDQLRAYGLAAPTGAAGAPAATDANHMPLLGAGGQLDSGFIPAATDPETLAGTVTGKFVTPKALQSRTLNAPTGTPANDANYLVRLDATGHIDAGFLTVKSLTFRGNIDVTTAYTAPVPAWTVGDFGLIAKSGTADGSYNAVGITGAVKQGDLAIWDGSKFEVLASETDLSAYVTKAGANALANDQAMTWTPSATLRTVLDGGDPTKSKLDGFLIDCGSF